MRKMISIFLPIALFFSHSFGQIQVGIKGGLNLSNVKNIISTDNTMKAGFNGGLLAEIRISRKFLIRPELLYSAKGCQFPSTSSSSGGILYLNYISIPILGGFRLTDRFTVFLGPEFDFLNLAHSTSDRTSYNVSKNFRKFDLAADLGLTYNINKRFGAEIRYSYGLKDLANVEYTDYAGNVIGHGTAGRIGVFQLGLFYEFQTK